MSDYFSDLEVTLRTFDALIEEIAQKSEVKQKDTENFFLNPLVFYASMDGYGSIACLVYLVLIYILLNRDRRLTRRSGRASIEVSALFFCTQLSKSFHVRNQKTFYKKKISRFKALNCKMYRTVFRSKILQLSFQLTSGRIRMT